MRTGESKAGRARALAVLEKIARQHGGAGTVVEVGRVTKIGEGLSRDVFAAHVSLRPDPDRVSDSYVVQLPRRDAKADLEGRTRKELCLLAWLQDQTLPFRVPRPLGVVVHQGGLALARAFVLLDPLGASPPCAVIDWEYALRGDPAFDLAIVTGGVRQPFQVPDGLDRLLETYSAAGGAAVTREHVRVHELALAGHWFREAIARPRGEGHPPEQTLALMRRILKMAGA